MTMPLTSTTRDVAKLTLTVVGDYPVPQQRLWDAFADPRQLERFWGPPASPSTFTRSACSFADFAFVSASIRSVRSLR